MFAIPVQTLLSMALVFTRISAVLALLPFYGDTPVPVRVRVLFAVTLTAAVWPIIPASWSAQIPDTTFGFGLVMIKEVILGMTIGFLAKLLFDGIIVAASLLGYQMGFGTASLFIPDAGMQMDSFTALHRIIVILLFLVLNFHHVYLSAITQTFFAIKPGGFWISADSLHQLIEQSSFVIVTAIQLAAPVLIALMFATAALGLMARAVPQLNVFVISFPVGFFVGLLVYMASLPFFPNSIERYTEMLHEVLLRAVHT